MVEKKYYIGRIAGETGKIHLSYSERKRNLVYNIMKAIKKVQPTITFSEGETTKEEINKIKGTKSSLENVIYKSPPAKIL